MENYRVEIQFVYREDDKTNPKIKLKHLCELVKHLKEREGKFKIVHYVEPASQTREKVNFVINAVDRFDAIMQANEIVSIFCEGIEKKIQFLGVCGGYN